MRILIATDAFPPNCGGSGWSTYELARGLQARGHGLVIVQPRPGAAASGTREYDGFAIRQFASAAPNVPFVRNYFKNERLYARLRPWLSDIVRRERIDIVHAQHVLTTPPAIEAARLGGVPVVCTVRDYWPVCYWSDLVHDYASDDLCPGCSRSMMRRCIRPRAGCAWPLAVPLVPYMSANLARKRQALARADAVVAVSSAIARDLGERAPELAATRVECIPNPVDIAGLRRIADSRPAPLEAPYALFVGKLAPNKGVTRLFPAIARARLGWPLVIVGDGPDRREVERLAAASGRDVRLTGWLPREDALAWLRHASLLVFPSHGPESLSRVLLEAAALGVPIAAMNTGGTGDIVQHEVTGLLSRTAEALGDDVSRLVVDGALRERLSSAARSNVERTFDSAAVVGRIETLYQQLIEARSA
jgi:glycosyltransferase involved in cell wall biosynthesis